MLRTLGHVFSFPPANLPACRFTGGTWKGGDSHMPNWEHIQNYQQNPSLLIFNTFPENYKLSK